MLSWDVLRCCTPKHATHLLHSESPPVAEGCTIFSQVMHLLACCPCCEETAMYVIAKSSAPCSQLRTSAGLRMHKCWFVSRIFHHISALFHIRMTLNIHPFHEKQASLPVDGLIGNGEVCMSWGKLLGGIGY